MRYLLLALMIPCFVFDADAVTEGECDIENHSEWSNHSRRSNWYSDFAAFFRLRPLCYHPKKRFESSCDIFTLVGERMTVAVERDPDRRVADWPLYALRDFPVLDK